MHGPTFQRPSAPLIPILAHPHILHPAEVDLFPCRLPEELAFHVPPLASCWSEMETACMRPSPPLPSEGAFSFGKHELPFSAMGEEFGAYIFRQPHCIYPE